MKMVELIVVLSLLKMELYILANGTQGCVMVSVVKCGQMVQDMKDIGNLIKLMDRVN